MARILVVEDEPLIAMMLCDWLDELGHKTVGPAGTAKLAIDLTISELPDYALVDVNLAGMRSDAVAEILIGRRVPFAFATGSCAEGLAHEYPSIPTLAKPYDFEAVRSVLDQLQQVARSTPPSQSLNLTGPAG